MKKLIKLQITNISRNLIIGLLAYLIISLLHAPQSAFADINLGIYPPILQIDATPPTSIRSPIIIDNQGSDPVILQISLKPFKQSPDNIGQVQYYQPGEWIGNDSQIFDKMELLDHENSIDTIALAPQQEKQLMLHIALPSDEPSGDYYFSIVFTTQGQDVQQSGSAITGGIATNVLLSVGPKDTTTGTIQQFSSPSILTHGPVPFTLLLQNTSSHFTSPTGQIVIKTLFGQNLATLPLLPVNVLARSSRYIPDKSSGSPTQAIWQEKALFGIYSANLSVLLSDQGPLFERTIYFIALPIWGGITLTILIICSVLITLRVRERMIRHK